eukprot:scaffold2438_cov167-Amphora_coffeaeformis.AAC.2
MKRRLTNADLPCDERASTAPFLPLNDVTARMISSSAGSIVTALAVTPLDVAKVRLQNGVPHHQYHHQPCPQGCGALVWKDSSHRRNMSSLVHHRQHEAALRREANSTGPMLRKIWAEEGISGLYRGIRPTLLMAVPNTMLYYTCYDELVQHVRSQLPAHAQVYAPLISGGTARLFASSATAPLEYMRTREASLSGSQRMSSMWKIIQTEGVRTLYRGLAPTLWRDVPFSAMYWLCIEEMRVMWRVQGGGAPTNVSEQFGQSFVNGFIAGTISACCTTPFDVVKTRQQAAVAAGAANGCHHNGASPLLRQPKQVGTWRALQHVARTEGVAGLWRGNWARTAKVAPSCAIMISSYEVGKRLLLVED